MRASNVAYYTASARAVECPDRIEFAMPKKPHPGRRGDPVSLYPLSPDDAIRAVLQIAPADVKRIIASKPGKKKVTKK